MSNDDTVLSRRARASRLATLGQRIGYGLYALAVVTFFFGLTVDFTDGVSTVVVACLVSGSLFLAPAIVVGYAVRAAVRDDIEHGRDVAQ